MKSALDYLVVDGIGNNPGNIKIRLLLDPLTQYWRVKQTTDRGRAFSDGTERARIDRAVMNGQAHSQPWALICRAIDLPECGRQVRG